MKIPIKTNLFQMPFPRVALLLSVVLSASLLAQQSHAVSIAACNSFVVSTTGFGKCFIPDATLQTWQWHEDNAVSLGLGFHLTSIHSAAENAFARDFADAAVGTRAFWIGLNDYASEGTFVWSDGAPVDYLNWNIGEPNNLNNEDGVVITDASIPAAARWNDYEADFGSNPGQYAIYSAPLDIINPPTSSIPEPGTLGLIGFGLVGLGAMRRRIQLMGGLR